MEGSTLRVLRELRGEGFGLRAKPALAHSLAPTTQRSHGVMPPDTRCRTKPGDGLGSCRLLLGRSAVITIEAWLGKRKRTGRRHRLMILSMAVAPTAEADACPYPAPKYERTASSARRAALSVLDSATRRRGVSSRVRRPANGYHNGRELGLGGSGGSLAGFAKPPRAAAESGYLPCEGRCPTP